MTTKITNNSIQLPELPSAPTNPDAMNHSLYINDSGEVMIIDSTGASRSFALTGDFDAAGSAALRVAKAGDTMTGQLKISADYDYGDLDTIPLRIVGSGQADDASGWPLLEIYNPDTNDSGQYDGEAKIFIRAGNVTTGNQRRYLHFRQYGNTDDDWIFGVNAADVFLAFDAAANMHRLWLIADGDTYINAAPNDAVRINFAGSDEVGTSFRVYRGGLAEGNNYLFYIENSTQGSMDSATLMAMNSGTESGPQSAYFRLQDNGVTKYYFGKNSSNAFLIRDEINSRNTLYVSPTNGRVGINDSGPVGMLHVTAPDNTTRALVADVPSGNTVRILECTKADAIQFAIEHGGRIRTNQAADNTNTPSGATVKQLPLYDAAGVLLGYVPVYGSAW